ncbi:MFS transporter [Streptomyces sp. NBC_00059]|uniref:MFS transporter n=1 Tax=Streptomyces sp. NBC_00059 TaxID=2975635 RepID=UPI0022588C6A|nr:MFS transporter [Streptomyces sp. NBC_00059]MCX5416803.1 MFS transporter [Streptomyces sp. NBC_00059]
MKTWRATSATGRGLLMAVLLTGLTTFMFLPLLALHLTAQGLPAGRTGFLVGLLAFCGQGFSLAVGPLVDRAGARPVMLTGFGLRIVGYVLLVLGGADRTVLLVTGIAVVGVGGSLLGLSIKTLLVREEGDSPRAMLALRSTFVNVGVVLGPALGALVYPPFGFRAVLAACVLSHAVLGLRLALLPAGATAEPAATAPSSGPGPEHSARRPAHGAAVRHWAPLLLVGAAFWALYSQLNVLLPLTAADLTGSTRAISVVFTLNGVLVILFQYVLVARVFRRASPRMLLLAGFLAFGCAYAVLLPQAGWYSLLAFVLPVTLAEILIGPTLDEQAVLAGSRGRTGLALGLISACGAVGSLLGSALGGLLVETTHGGGGAAPVIVAVSCAAAAACLLLPARNSAAPTDPHTATGPRPAADTSAGEKEFSHA